MVFAVYAPPPLLKFLPAPLHAEVCNEWRGPSPWHGAWATQKRHSGGEPLATVSDLTCPGIEPKTSRADNNVLNRNANWLVALSEQST